MFHDTKSYRLQITTIFHTLKQDIASFKNAIPDCIEMKIQWKGFQSIFILNTSERNRKRSSIMQYHSILNPSYKNFNHVKRPRHRIQSICLCSKDVWLVSSLSFWCWFMNLQFVTSFTQVFNSQTLGAPFNGSCVRASISRLFFNVCQLFWSWMFFFHSMVAAVMLTVTLHT